MTVARLSLWLLLLLLAGCHGPQSALDVHGPDAARIEELWWTMLWATAVPSLLTYLLILYAAFGPRKKQGLGTRAERVLIIGGGAVVPGVVVLVLLFASLDAQVDTTTQSEKPVLTIEVTGHQFWWEVRYPEYGIVTANELHIPVGRPVRIVLTSADVIHSFWVPSLHGKRDMIPGDTNELILVAEDAGVYRGQCAEFCGVQHALMAFFVYALPPAELAQWLEDNRQLQRPPTDPVAVRGLEVYREAECSFCHAIRGVVDLDYLGSPGPDLTHYASRGTLAAGTLDNTKGNLGGWLLQPQHHKPGNRMPPSRLPPDDLLALLHFLGGLE